MQIEKIWFWSPARAIFVVCMVTSLTVEGSVLPLLPVQQAEAEQVDFGDRKLHLVGDVHIVHEFGVLRCHEGTLVLRRERRAGDVMDVAKIYLSGSVHIEFTDGSSLKADSGEIDCEALEGVFTAVPPAKVVYSSFALSDGVRVPLRATGRKIRAKISQSENGYELSSMTSEGAVSIEYSHPETGGAAP